jgi:hypothetical protein
MQSEKPKVAKKAEQEKIMATPTPAPGFAIAVKKKTDERVAARLGSEAQEGVGSGAYSEFLHQWAMNVAAVYRPPPSESGCTPSFIVEYENGHVLDTQPEYSCGPASDQAFHDAIEAAPRPPMPTSFAGQQIPIIFVDTGRGRN